MRLLLIVMCLAGAHAATFTIHSGDAAIPFRDIGSAVLGAASPCGSIEGSSTQVDALGPTIVGSSWIACGVSADMPANGWVRFYVMIPVPAESPLYSYISGGSLLFYSTADRVVISYNLPTGFSGPAGVAVFVDGAQGGVTYPFLSTLINFHATTKAISFDLFQSTPGPIGLDFEIQYEVKTLANAPEPASAGLVVVGLLGGVLGSRGRAVGAAGRGATRLHKPARESSRQSRPARARGGVRTAMSGGAPDPNPSRRIRAAHLR